MLEFDNKQSREEYYVDFNFARRVTPGTVIETTEVTVYDEDNNDVTSILTDPSQIVISGYKVYIWVRGGTEQTYKITCIVTMDNSEKFEEDASLTVAEV